MKPIRFGWSVLLLAALLCVSSSAQVLTNTPAPPPVPVSSGSFFQSVTAYFTSFNTNLDSTFAAQRGSVWAGVSSISGGGTSLANEIGVSYDLYAPTNSGIRLSLENTLRDGGVAGVLVSEGFGMGVSWLVHDTRLTAYVEGVYGMGETKDKYAAEVGLRVSKALTEHTFAGVSMGLQVPSERRVLGAFVGFTF